MRSFFTQAEQIMWFAVKAKNCYRKMSKLRLFYNGYKPIWLKKYDAQRISDKGQVLAMMCNFLVLRAKEYCQIFYLSLRLCLGGIGRSKLVIRCIAAKRPRIFLVRRQVSWAREPFHWALAAARG